MPDEAREGDLPPPAPPQPAAAAGRRTASRVWLVVVAVLVGSLTFSLALVGGLAYSSDGFDWLSTATVTELYRPDASAPTPEQKDVARQQTAEQDLSWAVGELEQARAEARDLAEQVEHYKAEADRWLRQYEAALDMVLEYEIAAEEEALREEHAARTETGLPLDLPVEGLTHPEVQEQARAVIEDVVSAHEQDWPWLREAHDSADFVFYDSAAYLPCGSERAAACVLSAAGSARPVAVIGLDAVRSPHFDELVVHELAHVWANLTNEGLDMAAAFAVHYVGCRAGGLEGERLASELLADAVVMTVLQVGYMAGSWPPPEPYGYNEASFEGCLVDKRPSEELWGLLRIHLTGL